MHKVFNPGFFFLMAALVMSCHSGDGTPVFKRLSSEVTGVDFINKVQSSDTLNIYDYVYFYNGGGVALGDVNNDNLKDIFFTGNMVTSRLYINRGGWEFEDVTESAGLLTNQWMTGAAMVDINLDGYLDIYVSCAGSSDPEERRNLLFINNGDTTFTERAQHYGIADTSHTTQAAFFDYDGDGDLDLYLLNHAHEIHDLNSPKPIQADGSHPGTDKLYRNNGDGTFTDVSLEAGITIEGYGLGIAISDINRDSRPDVYVANDFISNDLIYINNGDGTFTNNIAEYLYHQSWSGMGMEVADYNNDGYVDIFVLDMRPESNVRQKMMAGNPRYWQYQVAVYMGYQIQYNRNTLQLNNGNGTFSEIGQLAGVDETDWSWSSLLADFDNDGYKDLFVSNGYLKNMTFLDFITKRHRLMMFKDESEAEEILLNELERIGGIKPINKLFENNGNLTFTDRTKSWGFSTPSYSNGAAYGDLDNDGDLDLVINNINDKAFIYRNMVRETYPENHYLDIRLNGKPSNPAGIGTKVSVYAGGELQYIEKYLSRGYQSAVTDVLHFGLGESTYIDSLEVIWPDGHRQKIEGSISVDQTLRIDYTDAVPPAGISPVLQEENSVFREVSGPEGIPYDHSENEFNDFKQNPLLPQMYSRGGPGLVIGDMDNNGLDDVYIGGAAGQSGTLFFQQQDGRFRKESFPFDKEFEDMGGLLFDADSDGDLDLYVVSGGNEFTNRDYYQDRLYLNDGDGNFRKAPQALPSIESSGSCVTAADYDRDGDLDLFVGGRIAPDRYPLPARNYLLQNNGGVFKDVTKQKAATLQNIGLVTSALWTDYDNDGWMDLMVAGEWMPISVFHNEKGTFPNVTESAGLGQSDGWWNSLISGDFDNDGDTDYIAGNLGLNTLYKTSPGEPLEGYGHDFDRDGTIDFVITRYVQGEPYPVYPRDMMIQRMPFLQYRLPDYSRYARAQMEDIFAEGILHDAYKVESTIMQTSFIENKGAGIFQIKPLPVRAQFSPVYGMISRDFNRDGNLDLLLAGNNYTANTVTGRYDASVGLYLEGDGNGMFQPLPVEQSGFFADGNTRSLAIVNRPQSPLILVSVNQESLKTFEVRSWGDNAAGKRSSIKLRSGDAYAQITFADSTTRKVEFTYGSGYLSQSSRILYIPDLAVSVEMYSYTGEKRTVDMKNLAENTAE